MTRQRHTTGGAQRHHAARHGPHHGPHLGATAVDLLVDTHLAQHPLGQRTLHGHHGAGLARRNQAHGARGADQKVIRVQPLTAMAVGMHQAMT